MSEFENVNFVENNKINTEALAEAFNAILVDAEKANKDNGAAGRRFRLQTVELSKAFLDMRKVTPKK